MKKDQIFFFRESCFFCVDRSLLLLYVFLFVFIILIMSTYYGHVIIQINPLYILLLFQISWEALLIRNQTMLLAVVFFSRWLPLKIKSLRQTTQDIGKHCPRRILWVVDHHLFQVSKLIRRNGFFLEYLNVKKWHPGKMVLQ